MSSSTPKDKEPLNKDLSSLPLMPRPESDPILDAPRYEAQRITDGKQYGAHVEFRITDKKTDSRIATCYVQENAEFIVAALNALPSERGTGVTCEHGTVGYCEKCALRDPGELGEQKPQLVSGDKWRKLSALEAKATPGPWIQEEGNFAVVPHGRVVFEVPCQGANDYDLPFLIALRNAWPQINEAISAKEESQDVPIARNEVIVLSSEYHQLAKDARRYEWLRDSMRRMPMGEKGTRHFFDQPDTLSFQEAVDEAISSYVEKKS